jgi:hypothetical protein
LKGIHPERPHGVPKFCSLFPETSGKHSAHPNPEANAQLIENAMPKSSDEKLKPSEYGAHASGFGKAKWE